MIRALIVADSGPVMASVTASVQPLDHVEIVGYAAGRSSVGAVVRSLAPDVVLVDEMAWCGLALARITEVRDAMPAAAIVGLAAQPDADWIVDGLRAGATAVVPRDFGTVLFGQILDDVVAAAGRIGRHKSSERRAA